MPFPLSVTVKISPFFSFIKVMRAREARACRATFVRAAWTILKIATAAERSNLAFAVFVLNLHCIPVCPSNSLASDFKVFIRPNSSKTPGRNSLAMFFTDRI